MPSVNIFCQDQAVIDRLHSKVAALRRFVATTLSCGERELQPEEVSIRIMKVSAGAMISPLEIELLAFSYPSRVKKQDVICRDVVSFLKEILPDLPKSHVWLSLTELGHSWEE
jgi:hypothetical protein